MKKVLFFLESLAGGGAEKVLSDIVCNLDKSKYDITVCTVTDEGVYQDKVSGVCKYKSFLKMSDYHAGGIKKIVFWLKIKFIYYFWPHLVYKIFIHDQYDIEIAFLEGFATKLIASANNHSKKIAWVHVDMGKNTYADKTYKNKEAHIATYRKYSKVVCVSNSVKEAFERKFFASENVIVQYNPVSRSDLEIKKNEKINILRPKGLLLGTIGRLEKVKGYDRLLKCVNKLIKEGYQFTLWIIGDGTQRDVLEKYIITQHLSQNIMILGFQKNPFKYMYQCDAFICSSYAEGFSTAATESLLLGKPIFTVNCAGMKELFGEQNCGRIVENTDKALYDMLKEVVSGKINLSSFSNDIRIRSKEFDINRRISDIENLLME